MSTTNSAHKEIQTNRYEKQQQQTENTSFRLSFPHLEEIKSPDHTGLVMTFQYMPTHCTTHWNRKFYMLLQHLIITYILMQIKHSVKLSKKSYSIMQKITVT